jgi:hypothetical protein
MRTGREDSQIESGSIGTPNACSSDYTYDANGNIHSIVDNKAGPNTNLCLRWVDRLTRGYTSGGTDGTYDQSYTYSTDGQPSEPCGGAILMGTAAKHAVTQIGSDTYTYDVNGNQAKECGGNSYNLSYDAENRLVGVSGGDGGFRIRWRWE